MAQGWQGFEFGERVYQCLIGQPGVGYRYSPSFADKVLETPQLEADWMRQDLDGGGPVSPEVVIVDAICQGMQYMPSLHQAVCCREFGSVCAVDFW